MVLGPLDLAFTIEVGATPSQVRGWTVRSVTGEGGQPTRPGSLTVLENGPSRYASRYIERHSTQLRVVEWTGERQAVGAVMLSASGAPRLSARYALGVEPIPEGSRLSVSYRLDTPILGLALSFRLGRRRSLVRRLSSSWLRLEDERQWESLRLRTARA